MERHIMMKRIGVVSFAAACLWGAHFVIKGEAQDAEVSKALRGDEAAVGTATAGLSVAGANAASRVAWQVADFKYRVPVQVKNGGEAATPAQTVRLELPLPAWTQGGKLRADRVLTKCPSKYQAEEVEKATAERGAPKPAPQAAKSSSPSL